MNSPYPVINGYKTCNTCKTHLPTSSFRERKEKSGVYLKGSCLNCSKEYLRNYRLNNSQRVRLLKNVHYKNNKEAILNKAKQYYQENKDRIIAYNVKHNKLDKYKKAKERYHKDIARSRNYAKMNYVKHKQKIKEKNKRYQYVAIRNVSDWYVKQCLLRAAKDKDKNIPQELVESYRALILLKREIKKALNNESYT